MRLGLFKKKAAYAIDYVKIPYHGEFNSFVMGEAAKGGKSVLRIRYHKRVENGLRFCIYSRPATLLDSKGEVIVKLIEEASMREVKIA